MNPLVLYHASCNDGFCAAWLMHKIFPDAEYIPVHYSQEPPDVTGRYVYILDFSYKRPVMEKIIEASCNVVVLEHHRTAEAELDKLDACIVFDNNKSGARLTWEFLETWGKLTGPTPWLVDYTEDRDLWRHALPHSEAVNAALRSYPMTFEAWDALALRSIEDFWVEGKAILRYQAQVVATHVRHAREMELDGHKILAVNATTMFSEIAGELAKDRPFGACWFIRGDGKKQWSLRSRNEGVDVSAIAKAHGGGGHRNAAGFEEIV